MQVIFHTPLSSGALLHHTLSPTLLIISIRIFPLLIILIALGCAPVDGTPSSSKDPAKASLANSKLISLFPDSVLGSPAFVPVSPGSRVLIGEVKVGTGTLISPADEALVHYTGWLTNGYIFDTSSPTPTKPSGRPLRFVLGFHQVLPGLEEGLQGMRVNGIRRIIIPAALAYGSRGAGTAIPPDSPLLFEVQLLSLPNRPDLASGNQ